MSHKEYQEWLVLAQYDEISDAQRMQLEGHLEDCSECRLVQQQLNEIHELMGPASQDAPNHLLQEARAQLRGALRHDRGRQSVPLWVEKLFSMEWLGMLQLPATAVACLLLGLFLGGFWEEGLPTTGDAFDPFADAQVSIADARFDETPDGQIEVLFQAVRPYAFRADKNDPRVQKVLTETIAKSRNPGTRMRAVSTIGQRVGDRSDLEVRDALINTLKHDENVGVRKRALAVLGQMPFDAPIKEAFLHVVINDANTGLRIAAINALDTVLAASRQMQVDEQLLEQLQKSLDEEENDFIRSRSKAFLEEVRFQ